MSLGFCLILKVTESKAVKFVKAHRNLYQYNQGISFLQHGIMSAYANTTGSTLLLLMRNTKVFHFAFLSQTYFKFSVNHVLSDISWGDEQLRK